ncbi:MAG: hypothetical protein JOZ38_01210, partial [Candidatus Eremiobacteraeota bacterium]|nr:hypothetical protein [Candidatus Eremiobacteraeota bacterium]
MKIRIALFAFLLIAMAATVPASAAERAIDQGGTYFGDVVVEPDQVVDGSITVLYGNATIEGTVTGDVTDVGGEIIENPGSRIEEQKYAIH